MSTGKNVLRERLRKQRQSLSSQQVKEFSQKITDSCTKILNTLSISSMHVYLPIEKYNEADTWPFAKHLWQNYPHVQAATWIKTPDGQFQSVIIDNNTRFKTDEDGFWQPQDVEFLPEEFKFDLIIVPLLGFDDRGNRLGFGSGFYDRYLKTQEKAQTIGLCYELGHLKTPIPIEPHDVPMKTIITEKQIYTYKSRRL
jgi:5-formyltetrahydrofolate cyclo-ligase